MTHNAPGHLAHGVDGKRIVARAYAVLDSYIYGFVHTELNLPFQNTDETREVGKEIFDQLPPARYRTSSSWRPSTCSSRATRLETSSSSASS